MALTKRGKIYHFDFVYKGTRHQGSTGQTNINKARLVEAKVRSDVALEHFGIGPPKASPTLATFLEGDFLTHVRTHAKAKGTLRFNSDNVNRLLEFELWKNTRLSSVDGELINKYVKSRAAQVGPGTLNGELAVLRKALRLAEEWGLITKAPKVRLLPAPKGRDFVVSGELENAYLAAAPYPLRAIAILMLDCGLRPDEAVSLRKDDLTKDALTIRQGKSVNAARTLPLTVRASEAIELQCALWPNSEWLFPGLKKGTHQTTGAATNMHIRLRRAHHDWPAEFCLYTFRHTCASRLAESGADPFHIKAILGHSDIRMTSRYIHIQPEGLGLTMKRLEAFGKMVRGESHENSPVSKD